MAVLALPSGVKLQRNTVTRDPATGDFSYKLEYSYAGPAGLEYHASETVKLAADETTDEQVVNDLLGQIYSTTGEPLPIP